VANTIAVVSVGVVSVAVVSVPVGTRRHIRGAVSRGIAIATVSRGVIVTIGIGITVGVITIAVWITVAIAIIGGGECRTNECTRG
jgi:hypothetical protein